MAIILSNNDRPEQIRVDGDFKEWADRYRWMVRTRKDGETRYAARFNNETRTWVGMHVEVWERKNGRRVPDGYCVDHENNDSLDNRYENLRLATVAQNNANRRVFKNSSTGLKGVSQRATDGKYVARITVAGKRKFLGAFDTPAEAAAAYDGAAEANYGEFAKTNFESDGVPREGLGIE